MFRQTWKRSIASNHHPQGSSRRSRTRHVAMALGVSAAGVVLASYKTRQWRNKHLKDLPPWQQLYASSRHHVQSPTVTPTTAELQLIMRRAQLTAAKSPKTQPTGVSQQLHDIRTWHVQHGYKGGLVIRELNKPLFAADSEDNDQQQHPDFELMDAMALARRECYYLYYELMGDGHVHQEIYCRGTTLWVDILTCLQFWWKYDDDLQCHVHGGFLNHANHLLRDVLPLLAPPTDKRATIEISGHSLGGAVAFLLAIKLKLLGYNVVKVTAIGAPRFFDDSSSAADNERHVDRLSQLLPPDTLRIEDDLDIVPFLPPFASTLGDKLWLVASHDSSTKTASDASRNNYGNNNMDDDKLSSMTTHCFFVPFGQFPWTESTWINFRCYDILTSFAKHHRVSSYMQQLLEATSGQQEEQSTRTTTATSENANNDDRVGT